jgi:hypothetical protein
MAHDHEAKSKSGPIVPPATSPRRAIERATAEGGRALDAPVRDRMRDAAGYDLSGVRVHGGPASAAAAAQLGARAFTLGSDIHLGAEAHALNPFERHRLLTHEAVHTIQQGGRRVAPQASMPVSAPGDPAEREAEQVSRALFSGGGSRSLALRDSFRTQRPMISRMVAPHVQRDITGAHTVKDGTFDMAMTDVSAPGGSSGMTGTITFTPSATAPDSNLIKLLQVARVENIGGATASERDWTTDGTGSEGNRNSMRTAADTTKGVIGGFFVDHFAASASPRTKHAQKNVSPYYRTYAPNPPTHDGRKAGTTIRAASLSDAPGSDVNTRFSFETAAKAADTGYHYATIQWGFTISDAAAGTVVSGTPTVNRVPTATFRAAVTEFNKFYKNKGTPGAP